MSLDSKKRRKFFARIAARDGEWCRYCGKAKDLTLDHITPLSRGGNDSINNLQILCRKHNLKKGSNIEGYESLRKYWLRKYRGRKRIE